MILNNRLKAFLGLVIFGILGTILSHFSGLDPGPIAPVSSILTIGFGVWSLLPDRLTSKDWVWIAGLAIGTASELVGLYTGYPFGEYRYTKAWFPTVSLTGGVNFPLMLPFAWIMIAGASAACTSEFKSRWAGVLASGFLAAAVDFFMEPVMVDRLRYWTWLRPGPLLGGAPILNFIGWWLTGSVLAMLISGKRDSFRLTGALVLAGQLALMAAVWLFPKPSLVP